MDRSAPSCPVVVSPGSGPAVTVGPVLVLAVDSVLALLLFHDRLAPIETLACSCIPICPLTDKVIGTLGTITNGTGPIWMSIGAPSISPRVFENPVWASAVSVSVSVALADADR